MCGIFGIINKKESKFDSVTFNVLGFNNDSRGGDSCGIFIDGKVEYGNNELKLYQNFYYKSELLKNTKLCNIALGHCRKASVGGVSPEKAQPVVIYDSEDKEKINFVLIHNGTIKNHDELAKQYIPDIDTKNMTDSQIIANIVYNCSTDVFGEYAGAGVFVFVDYRSGSPEVFIFKGESKEFYSSEKAIEERPLCFVSNKDKFIFSSLPTYLSALQPDLTVYNIPTNKLMQVRDCELYTIKKFDRKEKNMSGYTPCKVTNMCRSYYFDDYEDYYGEYYSNNNLGNYYNREKKKDTKDKIKGLLDAHGTQVQLADRIMCDNDFLFRHANRQLCHSRVIADELGYVHGNNSIGTHEFWFFNGVLLYSKELYKLLTKEKINHKQPMFDFVENNYILINSFSPYPFTISNEFDTEKEYYKSTNDVDFEVFSGQLPILFTSSLGCYSEGKSTGNSYLSEKESFNKLIALLDNQNESD